MHDGALHERRVTSSYEESFKLEQIHFHDVCTAAAEPFNEVRALDYSPAEYRNPSVRTFPIKRTRDEIVELVPRLYLGRALLTMPDGEVRLIAYFALREFSDERDA